MNVSELRAKRDTYLNTARSIMDGAETQRRGLTASESKDFDGLMAKVEDLNQTLRRAAQIGEMRADIERPVTSGIATPQAEGGMIYSNRSVRPGEVRTYGPREAISERPYNGPGIGSYIRGIVTGRWADPELRALAEGTPSAGGYVVPTPLSTMVIDLLRNEAQVVKAGAITVPMIAATLKMARLASDVSAAWKVENSALSYTDNAFQQVLFTANMLAAGAKISLELVEDAENIDAIVSNSIAKSMALALDYAALYGSGTAPQPTGIKNQTGVNITALGTNGLALTNYAPFSTAISGLMGLNVAEPFGAIYSARTAGELDRLVDTLGQPLRQPDLVSKMGKFVSNQVPNNLTVGTGTTCSDAFVGRWDQCMIGLRTGLTLEISREAADSTGSAFSNTQVWIRAYLRADVQLAHAAAFNVLTGIL